METVSNNGEARLSAYEYAYHFIKDHEWLRLKAYPDHKQRSICFGTKSYPWEVATLEDCYRRYKQELQPRVNKILKEHPDKNTCQQWALVSLRYNCVSCYQYFLNNSITKQTRLRMVYASWRKQWWLVKRRKAEWKLYTQCDW